MPIGPRSDRGLQPVPRRRRPFVTLYAFTDNQVKNHDVGFVMGDGENHRFYGDRLTFTLATTTSGTSARESVCLHPQRDQIEPIAYSDFPPRKLEARSPKRKVRT